MKRYSILVAVFVIALAIYGLDRGIYIGSKIYGLPDKDADGWLSVPPGGSIQGYVFMECRYLFVTGISVKPAHGGSLDALPARSGYANNARSLYCRFFGE
jgi:hypothetical protein